MSHPNPIIEYYDDEDHIYLRFRYISRSRLFYELSALKRRVRSKHWLSREGYWKIPKIDLQTIALFAQERFGPNTMIPVKKPVLPDQLELPFHENN